MLHVTRWRTIGTTAVTAVVAAGAFGLSASLDGPGTEPAPIRLVWDPGPVDHGPPPVTDQAPSPPAAPPIAEVTIVAPSTPVVEPASPGSPSSIASASSLDS